MKQLIRRLSRVADSLECTLFLSNSTRRTTKPTTTRRGRKTKGHVPIYVGEEMERFFVSAELLNHPAFIGLLNKSAQEYGYQQKGVLRIPCQVLVFEQLLEALRLGLESIELQEFAWW